MDAIGLVVNPVAGMGGRVGLKGTDGNVEEAKARGATPRAPDRAFEALEALSNRRPELTVYTAAGQMGEEPARAAGYEPTVVYDPGETEPGATAGSDTVRTVEDALDRGVDLVLFVGGDGTAVDVASALEETDSETPMLGVPAGVKVYSSVFGVTPADAGRIAGGFDRIESREVNDIDEAAYREGTVRTELKAVVRVPVADGVQSGKQLARGNVESLATGFAREIEPDRTYVFGPGGTVGSIQDALGVEPSPLGVDVWRAGDADDSADGDVLVSDGTEADILEAISSPTTVVVSPIGGQGFIFGRGNHQLSPAVLNAVDEITVVASGEKLDGLDALRVDIDDDVLADELRGWMRVRTGRFTTRMVRVV